jgi:hypothetical protein
MIEVYGLAEVKPDAVSKGRVLTLLRLFEEGEPVRKKFIGEMIGYATLFPYPSIPS